MTTDGVMVKKALTAATYAGLTLSDESRQANALFTLNKPAREFTLRLSGIDSEQGVKIQIFDTKGNLIEEQTIHGDATAFHANTYSYSAKNELVDIGSFKLIASEANVTLDGFTRKDVTHTAGTRDPNLIASTKENFFGSDANDVVTIQMKAALYMSGIAPGMGIHGGGGIDTLKIAGTSGDDYVNLTGAVSSMEIIELVGRSGSIKNLYLDVADVLRNGATDAFYAGDKSRLQMMIKASSPDSTRSGVTLTDKLPGGFGIEESTGVERSGDLGNWEYKRSVVIDGHGSFYSYQHSSLDIEVLVAQAIGGSIQNRNEFVETEIKNIQTSAKPVDDVLSDSTNFYTAGDDEIIARLGYADRLSGGAGNDTIRNVGTGDVVHAGSGDDTVRINSGDFAQVNGGLGIDTLVMDGKAMHIDLSAMGLKVQGFEKFDLGSGGNALSLSTADVMAGGARDMVWADGKVQMMVNGTDGEVNLRGGNEDWASGGSTTVSGVTYEVYTNLAGTAELLVEDKVHVTIL